MAAADIVRALTAPLTDINFLYFLMGAISVGGLGVATTLLIRGGRLEGDSAFVRHVRRMQTALPAVIVLSITTIVAGIQAGFERPVHEWLGWDFTQQIYQFEGDAVGRFQAAVRHPALDLILVGFYTVTSFLHYFVPLFILVAMGRGKSALRIALTLAGIWVVGVVAYFTLPVNEVWLASKEAWYAGEPTEPILFQVMPQYDNPTYMNSVNNNIPSLHTAVNVGIATALWMARERWLAIPSTIVAAGITTATVYLGIHWFVDVVAGILTVALVSWLVHRHIGREEREFHLLAWLRGLRRRPETPALPGDAESS